MRKTIFFSSIAVLCAATSLVSCSNDDDTLVAPTEEGLTTITVGAPSITTDGGTTRVSFAYDDGLNINWKEGDVITCSGYRTKDDEWGRGYTRTATADADGATTTFTAGTAWTDLSTNSPYSYTITYYSAGNGSSNHVTTWKTAAVSSSQSQAGNDNTDHLAANYYAILQNVNSISDISFSSTWAAAHASTQAINDGEELGKFYQSSCLKFDLTLPANTTVTSIKKIRLRTYDSDGTTTKRTIYWKNDHSDSQAAYQADLTITGLETVDCSSGYHLIGYMMLPVHDWTLPTGTVVYVGIDYDGSHWYYKKMAALTSDWTLTAGNLGVIKLNSTGWSK